MPIKLEVKPKTQFVTFAMKPAQGIAPLTVQFDASESFIPGETINGFIWSFGREEGEQTFGDGQASHTFEKPGEYEVKLTVRTESGLSEVASKTVVVRAPFLEACFTKSRSGGIRAPVGIRFFWECSSGRPTDVVWSFGDCAESESDPEALPSQRFTDHVFEKPGVYSVQLTIENATGSKSTSTQIITVK
jgi:PKD repeat protein